MENQRLRNWYMLIIAAIGAMVLGLCTYRFQPVNLNLKFGALLLTTVLIGSRITIKIPGARGKISVSDTFVFLAILLFGIEPAVLLAAAEALCSSIRFTKKTKVLLFNVAVMAITTFLTASALDSLFSTSILLYGYSRNLIVAVCVMAMGQYVLNSGLIAVSVALDTNQSVWTSWRNNFLWTSITYFAGASGAAIVGRLTDHLGLYAFLATAPIIAIVYFTYRTYLQNVETSASQAKQAKLHVEELNRYIHEQKRISKALSESEEHFRNAFDYAAIGMALVSPDGKWLRVNHSLCEILGYTEADFLVSDFQEYTHRDDLGAELAEIYRMVSGETYNCQLEKRYIHKLGHEVWASSSASLIRNSQGQPLHFIFQIQDISERKRAEAAIQTLSLVDELTCLYNRRGFLAFSKQLFNSHNRSNKGLAMIYADLDGLKQINDSFGHKEGDRALIKTAELLKESLRSSDVLGRWGGDEFTALTAIEPEGGIENLISRLEEKFEAYNATRTTSYKLSLSIGLAQITPDGEQSLEDLMARADTAMYENKRRKKNGTQFWETDSQTLQIALASV